MYNIPDIIIIYTYIIYYNNVKTDYYQRERERDVLSNILYGPLYSIYYNNNACTQTKSHAQTSLYLPWATAALSFHRHAPTWHEQTWAIAACHLGDCSVSSSHPKTGRTWERYLKSEKIVNHFCHRGTIVNHLFVTYVAVFVECIALLRKENVRHSFQKKGITCSKRNNHLF